MGATENFDFHDFWIFGTPGNPYLWIWICQEITLRWLPSKIKEQTKRNCWEIRLPKYGIWSLQSRLFWIFRETCDFRPLYFWKLWIVEILKSLNLQKCGFSLNSIILKLWNSDILEPWSFETLRIPNLLKILGKDNPEDLSNSLIATYSYSHIAT